jgi:hypothetical protein
MRLNVELQLMRDWQPRSRPTQGWFNLGEPEPALVKLVPGAAAYGTELMVVTLEGATRIDKYWAALRVSLMIEGTGFPGPRPSLVYLGESDMPTGIVHFPRMALDDSKMFGGWHSLLLRMA